MRDALGKEEVCASYKVSDVVQKDDMCQPKPEYPALLSLLALGPPRSFAKYLHFSCLQ